MKIDFSKIEVKDIEGNIVTVDISKELGNMMYLGAQDIAVADLGHEIYHKKEVEIGKKEAEYIKNFVERGFKAVLKRELLPMLSKI